jgi:5-formyltetrahydrofolate cyclo-ligase
LAFWEAVWGCNWITAEAISEREALRELLAHNTENTKYRSGLRELERQIVSQLALLGLSPSDRARLGIAEVKKESKLEELLRRKAEREQEFANQRAEAVNQEFINS